MPAKIILEKYEVDPSEAEAGETVKVWGMIKNVGDKAEIGYVIIYVDDERIYEYTMSSPLDPGSSFAFSTNFTMPNKSVEVKFYSGHWDSDENRWVGDDAKTLTVGLVTPRPKAKFTVAALKHGIHTYTPGDSFTVSKGDPITVAVRVKNEGGAGWVALQVWNHMLHNGHLWKTYYFESGEEKDIVEEFTINNVGSFEIELILYNGNGEWEQSDTSGRFYVTVEAGEPDIRIVSITCSPATIYANEETHTLVVVKNYGNAPGTTSVAVLSTSPSGKTGRQSKSVELDPGEEETLDFPWTLDEVGEWRFEVVDTDLSCTVTVQERDYVSEVISAFHAGFETFIEYMQEFAGTIQDLAQAAFELWKESVENFIQYIDWLAEWSAEKVWEVVMNFCNIVECDEYFVSLMNYFTDLYSELRTVEEARSDAEYYADIAMKMYRGEEVEYVEVRVDGALGRVLGALATYESALFFETLAGWAMADLFLPSHSMAVYTLIDQNMWEAAKAANDEYQYAIATANLVMCILAAVVTGISIRGVDRRQQTLFKSYQTFAKKYGKPIGMSAIAWAVAFFYMYVYRGAQFYHDKMELAIVNKLRIPWKPPGVGEKTGVLDITSEPTNAEIYIWQDNEWKSTLMTTPAKIILPAGTQKVKLYTIDWRGYPYEKVIEVNIEYMKTTTEHVILSKEPRLPEEFEATVVEIRDKGTVVVAKNSDRIFVRLAGLDMPQLFTNSIFCSQCGGTVTISWKDWLDKCKNYLGQIAEGEKVIVLSDDNVKTLKEWDSVSENEVDKLLAVLVRKRDNLNINTAVIGAGYACANFKPGYVNKHVDKGEFLKAGALAIKSGYGIFSEITCPKKTITITSTPSAKIYIDRVYIK